ncbi:MAG: class I SAM-dependent methyltransferase [Proteobacteria bacterium]|nr:class I SAM-dependent methyltransferase [Pseudomonadota bacterium]
MALSYDTIGINYSDLRKPDSRIAKMISSALGPAKTVLNVGAGSGSYEPTDRKVTAVEPSIEMIRQRPEGSAPVIQASAEDIPFDDDSFDASTAILTIHHWTDKDKGVAEMRRVTRGPVVFLTFDPMHQDFWLADYIPELVTLDDKQMPRLPEYENWLGSVEVTTVPVPHDCTDGFYGAYWRRPAAYLDPKIRAAISCFWAVKDIETGLGKLEEDLNSGAWEQKYGHLLELDSFDLGYRLVRSRG